MKKINWLLATLKANPTALISWLFPILAGTSLTNELFTPANAQSIIPAPDGTETIVTPQGNRLDITGGQRSRDNVNLFHSFTRFNLSSEQIANFLSHPDIQNILARINGGEASFINGLIQVTGGNSNLFFMNPSGIIFGSNARLNVPASFIATTANGIGFGNNWFNALGNNNYADLVGAPNAFAFTMNQPGTILNSGNLTVVSGETLALVGGTVINTGQLNAPSGHITLASVPGESFLRLSQPGFVLSLMIPSPTPNDNQPTQWTLPILSLPQLLTGGSGGNATGVTVNSDGTVQLTGSGIQIPTNPGTTIASNTINTSSLQNQGGTVHILGDRTGIISAKINVSGSTGGGNILIGGDIQGKGTVPNALQTFISADSTINADALTNGNGGKVIVWAEEATRIYGNISARGGQNFGNGGFVETSGRNFLQITTTPDVSAVAGIGGIWLIDPNDIAIVPGKGNIKINTSNPFEFVATGENAQLGIDLIIAALTGDADVIVTTGGSGNITFDAPLDFNNTGNNSLTLIATGNIDINADINDSQPGGDSLNLNLEADSDNSGGGRIIFNNVTVNTGGGNLTGIARGNQQFPEGIIINKSTINTSGGNINLIGEGVTGNNSRGIYIDNGAILETKGTGTITLEGISGGGTDSNYGLLILSDSKISVENGGIELTGIGNGTGTSTYGIWLSENSTVQTTGTGDITLTGTNNATGSNNNGIAITKGGEVVSTGTGNINLVGKGGNGTKLNYGIVIENVNSRVTAVNGDINLTGTGGAGKENDNYGILLQNGGFVEATGSGNITLTGTGGAGINRNDGIRIDIVNSKVSSVDGDINLTGTSNGTGNNNRGIFIADEGVVSSAGKGNITLGGTGGAGIDNNDGIRIEGKNARISSVEGNINLTGIGKGTGISINEGIDIFNGGSIESTKTGTITLTGTGSNGAAGIRLYGGSINPTETGSGTITFITDEMNIPETPSPDTSIPTKIGGTGIIQLQPLTPGLGITVGGNFTDSDTRLNLDTKELASLQNGFSQIVIGQADVTNEITINDVTFQDPVTIESSSGSIIVNGALTGLDNASITLNGNTKLKGNITTSEQDITINGNTIIDENATLDTGTNGGGNLLLNGTVDGDGNLSLNAGKGDITFSNAVGSSIPLGNFTINSADNVQADSITAASILQLAGTGTTTVGNLNANSAAGIDLTGNIFQFNGDITTSNNGGLRINNSGALNLPATLNISLDGAFNQVGNGEVFMAANISTTNDDIRFNAPVTLTRNATFNPGVGAIAFNNSLTANNNPLTLRASEIDFGGLVTGSNTLKLEPATAEQNVTIGDSLAGALNLSQAEIANIQNGFSSITIGRVDGTGTITINNTVAFSDPTTIQNGLGTILANAPIIGTDNASINLDAATTILNADIVTTNQNITIGRNTLLGSNVTLKTGSSTGDITFTGAVDGTKQLRLDAGKGNVRFNAGVGRVTPLGNLEINAQNVFVSSGITTNNSDLTFNMPVILTENASFFTGEGKANITFNNSIFSESGEANDLNVTTGGNISTIDITTNGGNIILNSTSSTVTTSNLDASSTSGNGGAISLVSPTGAVISGNLNAKGVTKGGNVTVISGDRINTGNIDVSASNGDGGNVLLDPPNNIEVGFINAQGGTGGKGGNVDITTARFFLAKNSFIDQNGVNSSISTAGGVDGGSITIRHGGGDLATPFIVGDATINGTIGALTTGIDSILPTRSFPGSFTLGNIRIITSDRLIFQLYQATLIERKQLPPLEIAQVFPVSIDAIIAALEETFTRQYEIYFQQTTRSPIKSLEDIRRQLLAAQQETGVKSAVIYIAFGRGAEGLEMLLSCSNQLREQKENIICSSPHTPCPIENCDRTENDVLELVLVTAEGEVVRHQVSGVTRSQILTITNQLQTEVNSPGSIGIANYLAPAQQLYQWLITPLQAELQSRGIQNLVFIPDVGMRTIPIAALHDGKKFIIEQYSVSLMPSFSLTNPGYFNLKNASVLAMGASNFLTLKPLPAVPVELNTITPVLWPGKTALNEAFTVQNLNLQRSLKPFEIVHLATHAEFTSGNPNNTYIQFWDTKLGLNEVKKMNLNNPPAHLLALSACKTAIGDEQAELGFAGLAVQTEAKSALASLWEVNDEGTLGLITEFYERLKTAPIRAEALRQAQVAMIRREVYINIEEGKLYGPGKWAIPLPSDLLKSPTLLQSDFSHPYFWAAFTLIGNPW